MWQKGRQRRKTEQGRWCGSLGTWGSLHCWGARKWASCDRGLQVTYWTLSSPQALYVFIFASLLYLGLLPLGFYFQDVFYLTVLNFSVFLLLFGCYFSGKWKIEVKIIEVLLGIKIAEAENQQRGKVSDASSVTQYQKAQMEQLYKSETNPFHTFTTYFLSNTLSNEVDFLVSYNSPSPLLDDKNPCHLPEAPGPCRGLVTRYFFDSNSQQCKHFFYGGCFGNANNFRSMAECQAKCQNPGRPRWTFVLLHKLCTQQSGLCPAPVSASKIVYLLVWLTFSQIIAFPAFTSEQHARCDFHTSVFSQDTADHSCCTTTNKIVPAQKINVLMNFSWAWNHIPPAFTVNGFEVTTASSIVLDGDLEVVQMWKLSKKITGFSVLTSSADSLFCAENTLETLFFNGWQFQMHGSVGFHYHIWSVCRATPWYSN